MQIKFSQIGAAPHNFGDTRHQIGAGSQYSVKSESGHTNGRIYNAEPQFDANIVRRDVTFN